MGKSKNGKNKCKCCGSLLIENYQLIYDEEGKRQNIELLLFDYIGKKVNENDGSDQAICKDCLKQLVQCYEFKRKCMEANNQLSSSEESENECEHLEENDDTNMEIIEMIDFNDIIEENENSGMKIEYLEDDEEENVGKCI